MSEQELRDILMVLLTGEPVSLGERGEGEAPLIEAMATFEEASVGDEETGFVVTAGDGSRFKVSVTRDG